MKSIFKLLLVLAIFGTTEFLAITPPNEIEKQPIEFSIADPGNVISLEINFVNLSMDANKPIFEEVTPVDMDAYKLVKNRLSENEWLEIFNKKPESFAQKLVFDYKTKKDNLIISKIKEYIPDFDVLKEEKRTDKRLYIKEQGIHTHYFLKDKGKDIRLITFIKKENPVEFSNDENFTASISIEESWY